MPEFRVPLINDEYYHVFNRGVARMPIFLAKPDYDQAILTMYYYLYSIPFMKLSMYKKLAVEEREEHMFKIQQSERHVDIVSFVFMPNHFHFLIKQNIDNGISKFISQFTNSYTRYFNTRHDRVGHLFQGVFKAVHVESDEQLIHLSRYIHLNPVITAVIPEKKLSLYKWSSFPTYLDDRSSKIIQTQAVLSQFSSSKEYKAFVLDQIGYAKELHKIKHLSLEE